LEADPRKHALSDRDVLGFAAVRGARQSKLVVPPMQIVEAAGSQEWHYLKRLGARSPVREAAWFTGTEGETVACIDDCRMHSVPGLNELSSRRDDVEFQRPHGLRRLLRARPWIADGSDVET
jgi:hypothetical protein